MKIKVSKISKNKNTFKTDLNHIGWLPFHPVIGEPLLLLTTEEQALHSGIMTSPVLSAVEEGHQIRIKTKNSEYLITKRS